MAGNPSNPMEKIERKPAHMKQGAPEQGLSMAKVKAAGRAWFKEHNGVACVAIACAFCAIALGIFLFVAFSDFGGSADFIYNQF